jgi:hypothetical protein
MNKEELDIESIRWFWVEREMVFEYFVRSMTLFKEFGTLTSLN